MGVEYIHFLFPEDRAHVPSADCLAKLVAGLVDARFLPPPCDSEDTTWWLSAKSYDGQKWGDTYEYPHKRRSTREAFPSYPPDAKWFSRLDDHDLNLCWAMMNEWVALRLRHPLAPGYTTDEINDASGALTIARTQNFQKYGTDIILRTPEVRCVCGGDLELRIPRLLSYCDRLYNECPRCGNAFDPSKITGTFMHEMGGWGKARVPIRGAGITKFAIISEPGKIVPDVAPSFDKEFVDICENALGQKLMQCGEMA
jgi:hypothetical protein